ncbi:hypothetical protein I314_06664 [Cryptococcus bacillisporus CA1873]|uniref:RING-type E3 ubiquitin transferase n=1 Tax=Cryptococcus bacillisporus CA1873 TaxID=1296111 RepID=A0ABR5B1Q9_CRYGA|nr:hypothetical protein I314_06664 [Cryptococcus bacillisporus CA1873]|eukprot:KIR57525.1 hypothetical protein I314_06664 [Cryptococcus gattii CA1873]
MPRKAAVEDNIYLDEAEDFILSHASSIASSPSRSEQRPKAQSERLSATRKKMDWEQEIKAHPDEPLDEGYHRSFKKREEWEREKGKRREDQNRNEEGVVGKETQVGDDDEDDDEERCIICLMGLRDRTIVGVCGHEFCFYLPPLPSKPSPHRARPGPSRERLPTRQEGRPRWGERVKVDPDELDMQVNHRRELYKHGLFVKHIASNRHTRFRPNPTPRQIASDPELIQRASAFIRRELHIWSSLDVEFLTTYIVSLLRAIDIRSEAVVRLLSDFLDTVEFPHGAEHFCHELYSYLRSPYRKLKGYDEVAQYDPIPPPRPPVRSPSPTRGRCRSRSISSYSSYSSQSYSFRSSSRSISPRSRSSYHNRSPLPLYPAPAGRRPLSWSRSPPRRSAGPDYENKYDYSRYRESIVGRARNRERGPDKGWEHTGPGGRAKRPRPHELERERDREWASRARTRADRRGMRAWGSNNGMNEVEDERGKGPGTKQRIELFPSPPRPAKKGLDDEEDSSTRNDRRDKPPHIHSPPSLASRLGPTVPKSTIPPQSNSEGQTGRDLPPHMVGRKLSIKGAAASKAPTNQPGMSLREKLVKAKAEAAEAKVNPSNQSETVQSISGDAVESGLELKTAEQQVAAKLSLRERLERAKAEAKSKAQPGGSPHNNANSANHCSVTHPPPTLPPEASSLSPSSNAQPPSINQDANVQVLWAKLHSRLKSQRERSLSGGPRTVRP